MFKHRFHAGIMAGDITRTIRQWKKPQVRRGGRYKLANHGYLEVTSIAPCKRVTSEDLKLSGVANRDALISMLSAGGDLYRVDFKFIGHQADQEIYRGGILDDDDFTKLSDALAKKDKNSGFDWTHATLMAIHDYPGVGSIKLCQHLQRDQAALKKDVRKLKAQGLTVSLETGYKLSERGKDYLRRKQLIV